MMATVTRVVWTSSLRDASSVSDVSWQRWPQGNFREVYPKVLRSQNSVQSTGANNDFEQVDSPEHVVLVFDMSFSDFEGPHNLRGNKPTTAKPQTTRQTNNNNSHYRSTQLQGQRTTTQNYNNPINNYTTIQDIILQHSLVQYRTLHYTCYNVLQYSVVQYIIAQYSALYSISQHIMLYYSILQYSTAQQLLSREVSQYKI